jgi:hypothetical protein
MKAGLLDDHGGQSNHSKNDRERREREREREEEKKRRWAKMTS